MEAWVWDGQYSGIDHLDGPRYRPTLPRRASRRGHDDSTLVLRVSDRLTGVSCQKEVLANTSMPNGISTYGRRQAFILAKSWKPMRAPQSIPW